MNLRNAKHQPDVRAAALFRGRKNFYFGLGTSIAQIVCFHQSHKSQQNLLLPSWFSLSATATVSAPTKVLLTWINYLMFSTASKLPLIVWVVFSHYYGQSHDRYHVTRSAEPLDNKRQRCEVDQQLQKYQQLQVTWLTTYLRYDKNLP